MKNIIFTAIFLGAFVLLFSQCSPEHIDIDNTPKLKELSAEEQGLVHTSNAFALDLFKIINDINSSENIIVSPLSIDFALNMAANGAAGDTKEEMKQTLGIELLSDEEANRAVKNLTDLLLNMDKKVAVSIANSIWYRKELHLQQGFKGLIEDDYSGKIEGLDFDDPIAKNIINKWVEEKTKGKIKDLIGDLSPESAMILVNAIYFKADWLYQFEKSQTKEDKFTLENGQQVPIQMMFSKGVKLRRFLHENLQLLEIPYGNGQFSMIVLLPHSGTTVQEVINMLTPQNLNLWISEADTLIPQLYLPKFTLKFKTELTEPLISMGMETPFFNAEFPHFFEENINLQISAVIHKAFIEVNEEGTEAAAATAIGFTMTSVGTKDNTIRIDRPFAFFIREKHSEAILFAGTVMNPTQTD